MRKINMEGIKAEREITADDYELDVDEDREAYIKEMESQGYRVVLPKDAELQIDIDTDDQYEIFQEQIEMLKKNLKEPVRYRETESRNGLPGRHITVLMPFHLQSYLMRIAFQAVLGSDPKRELLGLLRFIRGDEHPTLFVEKQKE